MPIEIDGENYYSVAEAARYLKISKPTFYDNVKPHITEYQIGAKRRAYYRQSDLDRYKGARPANNGQ